MALTPGSVWIGAQGIQSETSALRGIGRYIVEHTFAVLKAAPEVVGSVQLSPTLPVPAVLDPLVESGLAEQGMNLTNGRPAIYHVASPFEGLHPWASEQGLGIEHLWPSIARGTGVRTVVTLYDLIPLAMREDYLERDAFVRTTYTARLGLIRAADQVLTISERTAADAVEQLEIPEERITVIDSGVSDEIPSLVRTRPEAEAVLKEEVPALRRPFLLYVGGDDARKNLEGMVSAYARLPEDLRNRFQLAIVCEMDWARRADLKEYARRRGIRGRDLVLTGFVRDRVLAALYRACELFVFPSLYEGAGLPILEAMSCDAPVAASATSSIPEILGDLEATFDPTDPADMASSIAGVLREPGALDSLRERSRERVRLYTWERVAERTLKGYERALSPLASSSPAG